MYRQIQAEYGISDVYINEELDHVAVSVYDPLGADGLNDAFREYIKTLDDDRILLIEYDDLSDDD